MSEVHIVAGDLTPGTPGTMEPQVPGKPIRDDSTGLISGILPQLLTPVGESGLDNLMRHSDYVAQEVLGGIRRLIRNGPHGIQGIDRDGQYTSLPRDCRVRQQSPGVVHH